MIAIRQVRDDDVTMTVYPFPACEHHGRVLCDVCSGILATHDIIAFDSEGVEVATAMAEDRASAEVAASTLVEDGAEWAAIFRRWNDTVVAHHHRTTENGVPAIRRTSWFKD